MTIQELTTRYNSLFKENSAPDLAQAVELLTDITTDYTERDNANTTLNTLKETVTAKDAEITKLKQTNYQLFMSMGAQASVSPDQAVTPENSIVTTQVTTSQTSDLSSPLFAPEPGAKEASELVDLLIGKENTNIDGN